MHGAYQSFTICITRLLILPGSIYLFLRSCLLYQNGWKEYLSSCDMHRYISFQESPVWGLHFAQAGALWMSDTRSAAPRREYAGCDAMTLVRKKNHGLGCWSSPEHKEKALRFSVQWTNRVLTRVSDVDMADRYTCLYIHTKPRRPKGDYPLQAKKRIIKKRSHPSSVNICWRQVVLWLDYVGTWSGGTPH